MSRGRVLLEKLRVAQLVKKFLPFMKPEGSPPYSEELFSEPYPEPNESHLRLGLPNNFFLHVFLLNFCMHFSSLHVRISVRASAFLTKGFVELLSPSSIVK
jgi:hypothetical protein